MVWKYLIHRAGFEPALPKEPDLKSGALDHSATDVTTREMVSIHRPQGYEPCTLPLRHLAIKLSKVII